MSDLEFKTYKIKQSKSGFKVPVVNNVYIHSIYDPKNESNLLLNQHINSLKEKSSVLILGLGYGYHLEGIIKYFKDKERKFEIAVIDPNRDVVEDCLKFKQISLDNIKIYCNTSIELLFKSKELMNFLLKKPIIIPHPASFNLYRKYFTNYLTYKCNNQLKKIREDIENQKIKEYFNLYDKNISIDDCFQSLMKNKTYTYNDEFDFLLMAFFNICHEKNSSSDRQS